MHETRLLVGVALAAMGALYAVTATAVMWQVRRRKSYAGTAVALPPRLAPGVTVLKALCGAEPGLYEQLRSFCVQDYPLYQLVFGVREAADPALQVVRRLRQDFPGLDIEVVV
ncbi:MAG: bacteriohopanetetrol glucosamine biosynthesis glycosyltransferase HpnI, partial [Steroidobacteraceae bacterium]